MGLDRATRQDHAGGDGWVGVPFGNQGRDLDLGASERIPAGLGPPARMAAGTPDTGLLDSPLSAAGVPGCVKPSVEVGSGPECGARLSVAVILGEQYSGILV